MSLSSKFDFRWPLYDGSLSSNSKDIFENFRWKLCWSSWMSNFYFQRRRCSASGSRFSKSYFLRNFWILRKKCALFWNVKIVQKMIFDIINVWDVMLTLLTFSNMFSPKCSIFRSIFLSLPTACVWIQNFLKIEKVPGAEVSGYNEKYEKSMYSRRLNTVTVLI